MNVRTIDHVNLRVPNDGIDEVVDFYQGVLGFEIENLDQYASGERSIFSIRLNETAIIHIRPSEDFVQPADENYDHVALIVEQSVEDLKEDFIDEGIEIEMELEPLGATGSAPAIYIRDPFGYLIEIKEFND